LAGLRWDMPLLERHTFSLEALSQTDLNGGDERLHSQYFEAVAELAPSSAWNLLFGLLFEAMENQEGDFSAAFGTLVQAKTEVPGSLNDGLTVLAKFVSGSWNETFTAFTPLCWPAEGAVFTETLSGMAVLAAEYAARLRPSLFLENNLRYFFRTFDDSAQAGKYAYGGELWISLAWQPVDDIRLVAGGGGFFPALGNIYGGDAPQWKIAASLLLSF
jgi:hypothetical protein